MIEVRIHRGESFDDLDRPGTEIARAEFEHALKVSNVPMERSPFGEDAWWIRYPEWFGAAANELWYTASFRAPGYGCCALSLANPRILANAIALLDHALRVASVIGARVFVETREVTFANVASFAEGYGTEVADPWLREAEERWLATLDLIDDQGLGALEVPIDDGELAPDYAAFYVVPARQISPAEIADALRARGQQVTVSGADVFLMNGAVFSARVAEMENGHWQIRPGHGRVPWSVGSAAALEVTRVVRALTGGEGFLLQIRLNADLEAELLARFSTSGIEVSLWLRDFLLACERDDAKTAALGETHEWLEKNLSIALEGLGYSGEYPCGFDRDAVAHLTECLRRSYRSVPVEQREMFTLCFGAFLGECVRRTYGGEWVALDGKYEGLVVAIGEHEYVVPWNKVEAFLGGEDPHSPLAFFDGIGALERNTSETSRFHA